MPTVYFFSLVKIFSVKLSCFDGISFVDTLVKMSLNWDDPQVTATRPLWTHSHSRRDKCSTIMGTNNQLRSRVIKESDVWWRHKKHKQVQKGKCRFIQPSQSTTDFIQSQQQLSGKIPPPFLFKLNVITCSISHSHPPTLTLSFSHSHT